MGHVNSRFRSRFSDSDDDRYQDSDDDFFDGIYSRHSTPKFNAPPSKKRKIIKLKYNDEDSDEDYDEREYEKLDYTLEGTTMKIRNCDWFVSNFTETDLVKKENGYVRSDVYVTGPCNEFQFYFILHQHVINEEKTEYGLYVCVLSNLRSNATVYYQCKILNHKNRKSTIDKKGSQCPRKSGLRLLGHMCKEILLDDGYNQSSFLEDDLLKLCFKIDVEYKNLPTFELEKLFDENKVNDVTLVVKEEKFPANKKILASQSKTFAKLFEKNKNKEIEVNDVEPEIMKLLLVYLYTRKVPKLFTHADKLFTAANKYKLNDLKAMCKKAKVDSH